MNKFQLVILVSDTFNDATEAGMSGTVQEIYLKPVDEDIKDFLDYQTWQRVDFGRYRLVYGAVLQEQEGQRVKAQLLSRCQKSYRAESVPSRVLGTEKRDNKHQLRRLLKMGIIRPVGKKFLNPLQEAQDELLRTEYSATDLDFKKIRFVGSDLHKHIKDLI